MWTKGVKVVVAEDDYLVATDIKRLLKARGYEVVGEAGDGAQTLELVQSLQPDVVLMDIQMPGIDGLEAARQIQVHCPTPVVILSGNETIDIVVDAGRSGVGAFLTKPPEGGEIERAISIAITRHRDLLDLQSLADDLQVQKDELDQEISEHRRTEEALVKAKEAAEQASHAKSQFLANMSHEIRTPMNGIIGLTRLLLEDELKPDQRQRAEMALSSAEAMLVLINDILDLSKIEAGKIELDNAIFRIEDIFSDVVGLLAAEAHQKALEIAWSVDEDVPGALRGDAGRLRQVLVNLAGNAVKFTQQGHVAIGVELTSVSDCEVALAFEVRDTGVGIPPDLLDAIFDSFTQVDPSLQRQHGGTGLGLAICRQMAELMGGRIWVESELGRGSTFYFTARFSVVDEQLLKSPSEPPLITGAQMCRSHVRLLLVEDNQINREVALANLTKAGYSVDAVFDGLEAISVLEKTAYDLVLMDVQMPGLDGLEVTQIIRNRDSAVRDHGIPIIAMTAHAMKGDREMCIDAGMDGYVAKPIRIPMLVDEIERILARSRGTADKVHENEGQRDTEMSDDTPEHSPLPILDRSTGLSCTGGNEELLDHVIGVFVETTPERIQALSMAVVQGNTTAVKAEAHGLKGASGNIGARAINALVSQIEHLARDGNLQQLPELSHQLELAFDEFLQVTVSGS